MLQPKDIEINGKTYILTKFPAVAGREIITQYVASGIPKIGDYKVNEEMMLKLMCYVFVPMPNGNPLALSNRMLIDNHVVGDDAWETLGKIEIAMMEYNCSFFRNGRISSFFDDFAQKLPQWIIKISTALSDRSSQTTKRRSKS
jgi:hypothetical protein